MKIGQLILDPAGKYANVNVQDGTALAQIGEEHVVCDRLGATDAELRDDRNLRSLALNFFDEASIAIVWGPTEHQAGALLQEDPSACSRWLSLSHAGERTRVLGRTVREDGRRA